MQWIQVYMYNVSSTLATSTSCKSLHTAFLQEPSFNKKKYCCMYGPSFSIFVSSFLLHAFFTCNLASFFVYWALSLAASKDRILSFFIKFLLMVIDGNVPNINLHNCHLRWGSKCAGGKIRKNKFFEKYNTSLMKWRLLQKLRSEVEMTETLAPFGTFVKSDLNEKNQFLKMRSLIPCYNAHQFDINSLAIKNKASV